MFCEAKTKRKKWSYKASKHQIKERKEQNSRPAANLLIATFICIIYIIKTPIENENGQTRLKSNYLQLMSSFCKY